MSSLPDDSLPDLLARVATVLQKTFGLAVVHLDAHFQGQPAPTRLPLCPEANGCKPTETDLKVLRAVDEHGGQPKAGVIAKLVPCDNDENFRKRLSKLRNKWGLLGGKRNAEGYPLTEEGLRVLDEHAQDQPE